MEPMKPETTQANPAAPFSLSRTRLVEDIDAVDDIAGYAKINGREVAVHHLDATAYRAIALLNANPAGFDVTLLYDAVERACPALARDEIDRLSGPKIGRILAVAERGVKDVEASIPNGPRATETPNSALPSPSSPETPSDTSSPALPSPRTETSTA